MAKVRKNPVTFDELLEMGEDLGLTNNPLFVSTAQNHETVQIAINMIREELKTSAVTVSKEYVKGRENLQTNPLFRDLPKLVDTANKTVVTMLGIIKDLGKVETTDALSDYLNGLK